MFNVLKILSQVTAQFFMQQGAMPTIFSIIQSSPLFPHKCVILQKYNGVVKCSLHRLVFNLVLVTSLICYGLLLKYTIFYKNDSPLDIKIHVEFSFKHFCKNSESLMRYVLRDFMVGCLYSPLKH